MTGLSPIHLLIIAPVVLIGLILAGAVIFGLLMLVSRRPKD
jgi:hypothetical protein